ncbi:MAG: RdgB/HAM1 family non-canonical purine NTP pyrophosphatase [Eubacteriales bacterium]|nr:RdgB/HAM1 family non-canonical purine NTP pyrophosphatase [Eubacteriales bacterium]
MIKIVLASHNPDKLKEFREILKGKVDLIAPPPGICEQIEETGSSYEENALIKARVLHEACPGLYVLADDSGLSVDLLDGYPGIYSARFAGETASYKDKIDKLWSLLAAHEKSEWTAAFICALALINPAGEERIFRGEVKGLIWPERLGENGFGYDPIFYIPELRQTTAQLSPAKKHRISHRGRAVEKLLQYLEGQALVACERGQ